jgi:ubiquitin-protein ligase
MGEAPTPPRTPTRRRAGGARADGTQPGCTPTRLNTPARAATPPPRRLVRVADAARPPTDAAAAAPAAPASLLGLAPELLLAIGAQLPAEGVAALRAACAALATVLAAPPLWRALLSAARLDDDDAVDADAADGLAAPAPAASAALYCRRAIAARWNLPSGASARLASPLSPASPENDAPPPSSANVQTQLARRVRALHLGDGGVDESPAPRRALAYLDLNAPGSASSAASAASTHVHSASSWAGGRRAAAAAATPSPSAAAPTPPSAASGERAPLRKRLLAELDAERLRQRLLADLNHLVAASAKLAARAAATGAADDADAADAVSAFPAGADMLEWRARVRGLAGTADAGRVFELALAYGAEAAAAATAAATAAAAAADARAARRSGERAKRGAAPAAEAAAAEAHDAADGVLLPAVRLLAPSVRHPNVAADGRVCAAALAARCGAAAGLRAQLLAVRALLARPHFGVRPLDRGAAAAWLEAGLHASHSVVVVVADAGAETAARARDGVGGGAKRAALLSLAEPAPLAPPLLAQQGAS